MAKKPSPLFFVDICLKAKKRVAFTTQSHYFYDVKTTPLCCRRVVFTT